MQLANFMNEISVVETDTWRQRLSARENFDHLERVAQDDFLAACDRFWFVTTSFTAHIYGTVLSRVRDILPESRLSSVDLIRGVLLHFACREATPGSYVLLTSKLCPSDIAFVDFPKTSGQFVLCEHPRESSAIRVVPAFGNLLFDATPASLAPFLSAGSVCTLVFDLDADAGASLNLLRDLSPLLSVDATLIAHGQTTHLHGLFAQLTTSGAAKLWAQRVVDGPSDGHASDPLPPALTFAYFQLLDKAALGTPRPRLARIRPNVERLEPPLPGRPGPNRFLERDQIGSHSETVLAFAPERVCPVRAPLFIDLPEGAGATWRGQFGKTAQEWLGLSEMTCPPLQCFLFDQLRIIGTEMLVSQDDLVFTASQQVMTEQYFASIAPLLRADAALVDGGVVSRRATTISQRVRAPVVILSNGGLPMHYHFLFDALPRLWFLNHEALASFSIALPDTIAAYQVDALTKYYDIEPDRIEIFGAEDSACVFERACVAPSMVSDWWAMPETIVAARTALRHAVPPRDAKFAKARRLYVSRRDVVDSRGLVNESELVERLEALGFVEVFPSSFSYDQEMSLFHNAELVVGLFGSGMANVMFCAPGTKVVFLQPDSTNWRIMSFVMESLDLQYGYIFGEAFRRQSRGHNTEWIIDVDAVVARLRRLL